MSVLDQSAWCAGCVEVMQERIAEWEELDSPTLDKPIFHPVSRFDGSPVHFFTAFAVQVGIGGSLCGDVQAIVTT